MLRILAIGVAIGFSAFAADVEITAGGELKDAFSSCSPHIKDRLLAKNVSIAEIIEWKGLSCGASKPSGLESLGYVTPWNGGGASFATRFSDFLTYVSPVWFQVEDGKGGKLELRGEHNLNAEWLREVKRGCSTAGAHCTKVVPRFEWKSAQQPTKSLVKSGVKLIMRLLQQHSTVFDGVVLEAAVVPANFRLFEVLGKALHDSQPRLTFVLVIPPSVIAEETPDARRRAPGLKPSELLRLGLGSSASASTDAAAAAAASSGASGPVDRFSLMTYDYSIHRGRTGPNAPLFWQNSTVAALLAAAGPLDSPTARALAQRILLGVPFYGYDNAEAIVGHSFIDKLEKHGRAAGARLRVNAAAAEHSFSYTDAEGHAHEISYPTPWMVARRVALAKALGTGISIWELGQGLDCFTAAL